MSSKLHSTIARTLLIGILGVSLGMILTVSGVRIKIVDSKSSWQTYTNREFGFSFRYPDDWKFYREDNRESTTFRVTGGEEFFSVVPRGADIFSLGISARRVVIAQRNAVVVDRSEPGGTRILRDAYFYEPEGFRISIGTDSSLANPLAFEVFKTFRFLQ